MKPVAPAHPLQPPRETVSNRAKEKQAATRTCRLTFLFSPLSFCFPGAFPVSAHRSQFPKGPGRVFPRHPHQQGLPERSGWGGLLSCTECFPGKLAPFPGLPPHRLLCHRHPNLHLLLFWVFLGGFFGFFFPKDALFGSTMLAL